MLSSCERQFESVFQKVPTVTSFAPGRIEFIGNHTDYNGGEVLGAAIDRRIAVAMGPRSDYTARFVSDEGGDPVVVDLKNPVRRSGRESWVNYPLGVYLELVGAGMERGTGFDFGCVSDLPSGAGLSSSAALELSSARALCVLNDFSLSDEALVLLCQRAENNFVGVPCGILDQGVSCFGRADHLVHIDCATVRFERVAVPGQIHFWIFNSNQKHSLLDSLYAERHRECREALEVIRSQYPEVEHLAQVSPAVFRELRVDARFTETHYARARHVSEENARVRAVVDLLGKGDLAAVGDLLLASHNSSSVFFQNSTPALDALVQLLAAEKAVYGARLTGGGFGGAAMAMTSAEFGPDDAERIVSLYAEQMPNAPLPTVFHARTGDGAHAARRST